MEAEVPEMATLHSTVEFLLVLHCVRAKLRLFRRVCVQHYAFSGAENCDIMI